MTEEEHIDGRKCQGKESSAEMRKTIVCQSRAEGVRLMRTEKLTHAKPQVKEAPESPTIGETSPRYLMLLFRNTHNSLNH